MQNMTVAYFGIPAFKKICEFVGMDGADVVMEKLMSGIDTYTTIRNTEKAEEAARLERERIRQEQAHE